MLKWNILKYIIESGIIISNPSYLTKENSPAVAKDNKINFLFFVRKDAIIETPKNKYSGSVNPKMEFSINDGSNTKNVTTINEYGLEKNLLPRQ